MQDFERRQARALIDHCLSHPGATLTLLDEGEEVAMGPTADGDALLADLHRCDMMVLRWRIEGRFIGGFMLVFGNGPGELIADCHSNPLTDAAWQHVQDVAGE